MICRNDQMILNVSDIKVLVGKKVVLPSKVNVTDQHICIYTCKYSPVRTSHFIVQD